MLETLKCSRIDTEDDYTKILCEDRMREFHSGLSAELVRPFSSNYRTIKV